MLPLLIGATGTHVNGAIVRVPAGVYRYHIDGAYDKCSVIVDKTTIRHPDEGILTLYKAADVTTVVLAAKNLSIKIVRV